MSLVEHEVDHAKLGLDKKIKKLIKKHSKGGGGGGGLQVETDPHSLHLDQTQAQHVVNGAPIFEKGLIIKAGERIYFDG